MQDADVRAWCESIAEGLKSQAIDRDGHAYLTRYFAGGWSPWNRRSGAGLYLHHFVDSDPPGSVHSHPWAFAWSLIVVGAYREERCEADGQASTRDYRPGDVNVLHPGTKHRVTLLTPDVWSVFLAGPYLQPWSFYPSCDP
jgi:hypothetical protein